MDSVPESVAVRLKLDGYHSWSHTVPEPVAVRLKLNGALSWSRAVKATAKKARKDVAKERRRGGSSSGRPMQISRAMQMLRGTQRIG